jgi:hypothetical protein
LSFVPIIVTPPPPPSPQAQELGRRVQALIEQFRMEHPGLSSLEVNQALQLARPRTTQSRMIVAALLTAILLLGILLLMFLK